MLALSCFWLISTVSVLSFQQQTAPTNHRPVRDILSATRDNHGDVAYPDPPLPNFCANCGSSNMIVRVPEGDERPRACCGDCDAVVYVNPKVVVSTVVLSQAEDGTTQCLLAKRAIDPRKGYWGIPQGFQELGETSREAAVREAFEETGAVIDPGSLRFRAVYNVPGSVQLVYQVISHADLEIATSTLESTDVGFFPVSDLPELCFPTVQWAIDHCTRNMNEHTTGIQQKTKTYDAATNTWGEFEDEVS